MKKQGLSPSIWLWPALLAAAFAIVFPLAASAQEPSPPRPDPPPDRANPPPGRTDPSYNVSNDDDSGSGFPAEYCSTVYGTVFNVGHDTEGRLPVNFSGPGWQTELIADDNGFFASNCLGLGVAVVNTKVRAGLTPLATDVAIRLGYIQYFKIDLGVYGGNIAPTLPVTPTMDINQPQAKPKDTLVYTIRVSNPVGDSIQTMRDVILTDLLPYELELVNATSTAGTVELWGNLVTANIGTLPPGQAATVTVTALVQNNLSPASQLVTNRASLIYADHVVTQTPPVTVKIERQ